MEKQLQIPVSPPDEVQRTLVQHLQGLVDRTTSVDDAIDELLDVLAMLNALPLSTSEFGLAVNRLKNAHRYLVSDERGAARYELRMLLGTLNARENERPVKRRFRRRKA